MSDPRFPSEEQGGYDPIPTRPEPEPVRHRPEPDPEDETLSA